MTSDAGFGGGGRFLLTPTPDGAAVVKEGDPRALAREARALRLLADTGLAPRLVAHRPGRLTTALVTGRPVPTGEITATQGRALGAALGRLHAHHVTATGGRHVWPTRVRSPRAYALGRLSDLGRVPHDLAATARTVAGSLTARLPGGPTPFHLLHGDLVAANIVWTPRPVLVDWEFWRQGDPAEDLAYLFEVNALGDRTQRAVLAGYGQQGMAPRVDAWRAFCALDAGLWYRRAGLGRRADALLARARALSAARPGG